jgi:hypothetical protein
MAKLLLDNIAGIAGEAIKLLILIVTGMGEDGRQSLCLQFSRLVAAFLAILLPAFHGRGIFHQAIYHVVFTHRFR